MPEENGTCPDEQPEDPPMEFTVSGSFSLPPLGVEFRG